MGGEDRPIAPSLLRLLDFVCPNESELARLTQLPTDTEEQVGLVGLVGLGLLVHNFHGAAAVPAGLASALQKAHSWLHRAACTYIPSGKALGRAAQRVTLSCRPAGHFSTVCPSLPARQVLLAAGALRARGARNVLVTLGSRGALLLRGDGTVLRQEAVPPPGGAVVDTTAAGDAFRAAFVVALVGGRPLQECLRFAAAAGALAVSRLGAVSSLPRRAETECLAGFATSGHAGSGTCGSGPAAECSAADAPADKEPPVAGQAASAALPPSECPYKFASRLNSMRARRDLAGRGDGGDDVAGWVKRQSRIRGLSLVDFNHPQVRVG